MLTLAIPIVLQNLISIGLNMADTVMIGKLGVDELAAVGTANRVYFIFSTINFGIYSGAAVYVSQYWGVRDVKNIRRTFGIDIMLGVIVSMFSRWLRCCLPRRSSPCLPGSRTSSIWAAAICGLWRSPTSSPR